MFARFATRYITNAAGARVGGASAADLAQLFAQARRAQAVTTPAEATATGASSLFGRLRGALAAAGLAIAVADDAYVHRVRAQEAALRAAIEELLDGDDYDGHGSYAPVFVRLAWHSSGTWAPADKAKGGCPLGHGGSNGGAMRFAPERDYGANNGLGVARDRLEAVKAKFPDVSYADIYTLAGVVAVEATGGPLVAWRPGRSDYPSAESVNAVPDGRLPDASLGAPHVRAVFGRMGFSDREMVALIGGGHALGKAHPGNSGYSGPWTRAPTTFSNQFFVRLRDDTWVPKRWDGPLQFENVEGRDLMMLPADIALITDSKFRPISLAYADDEEALAKDFAAAFSRLLELGVPFPPAAGGPAGSKSLWSRITGK